jgi:DNA repair exonuclease SbcCD ATPase subunit
VLVRSVKLRNFTIHDSLDLEFPETGLILITGANGAGKSSVISAVAAAGWGMDLRVPGSRKSQDWREGEAGSVELATYDGVHIRRSVTKSGMVKLKLLDGSPDRTTTSKAQEALESQIGDFDIWRRSHVISSSDTTSITTATDAGRRELLEALLHLGRFAKAHEIAKKNEKAAKAKVQDLQRVLESWQTQIKGTQETVEEATSVLQTITNPVPPTPVDLDALRQQHKDLKSKLDAHASEIQKIHEEKSGLGTTQATLSERLRAAQRKAQLLSGGACPTCEQSIPESLSVALTGEVQQVTTELEQCREAEEARRTVLVSAEKEHQKEVAATRVELEGVTSTGVSAKHEQEAYAREMKRFSDEKGRWEQFLANAGTQITQLKAKEQATAEELQAAERDLREIAAACEVLGPKGVRSTILGDTLGSIEILANGYLRQMGGRISIQLSSYEETNAGKIKPAISLTIHGAGGGKGHYWNCSGGERRRIDIALTLALASLAASVRGGRLGTLFLDEAMDALDEDGAAAVLEILDEIAKDRCVVLISHSPTVIGRAKVAKHIHLERPEEVSDDVLNSIALV